MHTDPIPINEPERLESLRTLRIMGTPPEESFDRLTALTARMLGTSAAAIILVDTDRVWLKSRFGIDTPHAPRAGTPYAYTIVEPNAFVVPDMERDERFATRDESMQGMRLYAGVPLVTDDGHAVGTLCVFDTQPRELTHEQVQALRDCGQLAMHLIDARARELERDEIQSQQQRLKRLMHEAQRLTQLGGWSMDLESGTLEWTEEVYRIHALDPTVSIDIENAINFYAPHDRRRIAEAVRLVSETGRPYDLELDFVDAIGTPKRVRATGRAEHTDGRVAKIYGAFQDVSEHQRVQEALREKEERLRVALSGAKLGLWDYRPREGRLTTDGMYFTMLGYEERPNQVLSDSVFFSLLHPEDAEWLPGVIEAQAAQSEWYTAEFRLRCADGSYAWIYSAGRVTARDSEGTPERMVGVHLDISDRRGAITALERGRERLRAFVKHMPASVAMLDRDMNYLVVSRGWYELYELEGDLTGRCHYDVFPDLSSRCHMNHRRVLAGESLSGEHEPWTDRHGQRRWNRWNMHPWRDEDGSIGGIVIHTDDMTERVLADAQLREAREAEERTNRARNDLLTNVSHEIRTPMTALLGYTEELVNRDEHVFDHEECVRVIRSNGEHLLSLLNDFLDLSKLESGRVELDPAPVRPQSLVRDVAAMFRSAAEEKGVLLEIKGDGALEAWVILDALRTRQVLVNLVGNAIKFTDSGRVAIECELTDGHLQLRVRDSGIGIASDRLAAVFDPFTQADTSTTRRFGGTGLGLAISKNLVDLMGGSLAVESVLNRGSCFTLSLPAPPCPASRSGPQEPEPRAVTGGRTGRVLLVEDSVDNRRLLAHHLRRAGLTVEEAEHGQQAVEVFHAAQAEGRPFQLVFMDIQMPVLDGYEATQQLRRDGVRTPILALTAHAMPEERQRCLAAGCDDYYRKPIAREALIEACDRWLASGGEPRDRAA